MIAKITSEEGRPCSSLARALSDIVFRMKINWFAMFWLLEKTILINIHGFLGDRASITTNTESLCRWVWSQRSRARKAMQLSGEASLPASYSMSLLLQSVGECTNLLRPCWQTSKPVAPPRAFDAAAVCSRDNRTAKTMLSDVLACGTIVCIGRCCNLLWR